MRSAWRSSAASAPPSTAHLTASAPAAAARALAAARDTLGGAVTVAARSPGTRRAGLLDAARAAFTDGMHHAAIAAAVTMVLAAVLSAVFFRGVRVESPATAEEPPAEAHAELAA